MPRITQLPEAGAIQGDEQLVVVQDGVTRRCSASEFLGNAAVYSEVKDILQPGDGIAIDADDGESELTVSLDGVVADIHTLGSSPDTLIGFDDGGNAAHYDIGDGNAAIPTVAIARTLFKDIDAIALTEQQEEWLESAIERITFYGNDSSTMGLYDTAVEVEQRRLGIYQFSDTEHPTFYGSRVRVTNDFEVENDDLVLELNGSGWIGSSLGRAGSITISMAPDGDVNSTSSPGEMRFSTTPESSTTPALALTIDREQNAVFEKNLKVEGISDFGVAGTEGAGVRIDGTLYTPRARFNDVAGAATEMLAVLHKHSTSAAPIIASARSNSNNPTHSNVTTSMPLLDIIAAGWMSGSYRTTSRIRFMTGVGTISSTSAPGRIEFATVKNGEVNLTNALVIDEAQNATFTGTATVANATADGHAVNRTTGDGRYGQLAATNTWAATQTFSVDAVVNGVLVGRGAGNVARNTVVGAGAFAANTTSNNNTVVGWGALAANVDTWNNMALGYNCLKSSISDNNMGIGPQAGENQTTGGNNVYIGREAGSKNITGSQTVYIGNFAARNTNSGGDVTIANNSVFIGQDARPGDSGQTNQLVIGHNGRGNGSNTVTFGNSSTLTNHLTGQLRVTDSIRPGSFTVATVPSASARGAGAIIYVSDETGGATLAFSDGTDWRRVSDRAVISA